MKNITAKLYRLISLSFGIMMTAIVFICLFLQNIRYARKGIEYENEAIPHNFLAIVAGITFIIIIYFLLHKLLDGRSGKYETGAFIGISIFTFILQVAFVFSYYFFTDWDVNVLTRLYILKAETGPHVDAVIADYFSMYPNNLFLQWVLVKVSEIPKLFGFQNKEYDAILLFLCLINQAVCIMTFFVSRKILRDRCLAWTVWILNLILVGFSPWTSIPYSDSVGLLFPMLFITIYYMTSPSHMTAVTVKFFVLGAIAAVGYAIKPQTLIIGIAVMLIGSIDLSKMSLKRDLSSFAVAVIAFLLCSQLCTLTRSSLNIPINEDKAFGMTHFLMMGLNEDEMGVWNEEDKNISSSVQTKEDRQKLNLEVAGTRVQEMGVTGLVKQAVRKTLTNFNDGSFGWGGEGVFYFKMRPDNGTFLEKLTKNIYYNRSMEGKLYKYYDFFTQAIWLGVMASGIGFILRGKEAKIIAVLLLALIGLTVFETLFEARARYLYIYVPVFCICAAGGIRRVTNIFHKI